MDTGCTYPCTRNHFLPPHTTRPSLLFEHLPTQTDWTPDLDELLLSDGPTSASRLRSPTLSAPDLAPSYDHAISAPSCDQPVVEIDDLPLRLIGHEVPSAFPTSDTRNDRLSGLNRQLSLSTP